MHNLSRNALPQNQQPITAVK